PGARCRICWRWPQPGFVACRMNNERSCRRNSVRAPAKLYLASSNPGKLGEFRALAAESGVGGEVLLELLPNFARVPTFEEDAPTFAENALGKVLHYSRTCDGLVFADDSGLVVPALGGRPGVHSARYAGEDASNDERIAKLIDEMSEKRGAE